MKQRFSKMHGIGNDFVIVDCRERPFALTAQQIAHIGDRHRGVGFDQLLTIEPATDASCAFAYRIFNTDGTTAQQCGNGLRCVVAWLHRAGALPRGAVKLQSPAGPIAIELLDDGRVRADMGMPTFDPPSIPFDADREVDEYNIDLDGNSISFGAVSMGNPHAVIEVADVAYAPLKTTGAALSIDPHFPNGCNAGFAQIIDRKHIRLRVWERGAGATLACGSGACAAVAILRRRGKLDDEVTVELPGGTLQIEWAGAGSRLWMSGPAAFAFEGEIEV
jgi:diaminopimelate epimerase